MSEPLLTAEQILAADDLPTEDVPVPEWHGTVRVQGLTGSGRDRYFAAIAVLDRNGDMIGQDMSHATAMLISQCVVNEAGEPLFTQDQVAALGRKSAVALARVYKAASRLSGLGEDAAEALEKDSAPTLNGASASPSPSGSGG